MLSFHSCPGGVGRPSSIWWGRRASPVTTIFRAVLQDISGRGVKTNKLSAATDLLVPAKYDHARKGSGGQVSIVHLFRQRRSIPSTSRTGKAELTFASEPSNFLFSYLFTFLLKTFIIIIQGYGDRVSPQMGMTLPPPPPRGYLATSGDSFGVATGRQGATSIEGTKLRLPPPSHILLGTGQITPTPENHLI